MSAIVPVVLFVHRYVSRCLLLNFHGKPARNSVLGFARLHQLMPAASSAIGEVIALGDKFFTEGMAELDEVILPQLHHQLPPTVLPRVIPAYATLVWFTKEVSSIVISLL